MALINCPECKKEISDKVKDCPYCGFPFRDNNNSTNQAKNVYDKNWNKIKDFNEWKPAVKKASKVLKIYLIFIGIVFSIAFILIALLMMDKI